MIRKRTYYLMELVAVLVFVYITLERAKHGIDLGRDTAFHISRIYELRQAFLQGHLPAWINLQSFFGLGQAINGMYPDITLWPFVVATLWLPFSLQITAINSLIFTMTYVVSFLTLKHHEFDSRLANAAAILYTFSGYSLYSFIVEIQPGTAIIYAFSFPFLFYIIDILSVHRLDKRLIAVGTILFTIIIFSHLLSTVVFAIILIGAWVTQSVIKDRINWVTLLNVLTSSLITIITGLPILLRIILIGRSGVAEPFGKGLIKAENVGSLFANPQVYARTSLSIVVIVLLILIAVFAKKNKLIIGILIYEMLIMVLCTKVTPWGLLQKLPMINMLQVAPWRFGVWLSILPVFGALVMKGEHLSLENKRLIFACLAIGAVLGSIGGLKENLKNITSSNGLHSALEMCTSSNYGAIHNRILVRDYAPKETVNTGTLDKVSPQVLRMAYNPQVQVDHHHLWAHKENIGEGVQFRVATIPRGFNEPILIQLPMYGYKSLKGSYMVKVNGNLISQHDISFPGGFLAIHLRSSEVRNNKTGMRILVGFRNPEWYGPFVVASLLMVFILTWYLVVMDKHIRTGIVNKVIGESVLGD